MVRENKELLLDHFKEFHNVSKNLLIRISKEIKEIKNVDGASEMVESKYKRDAEQAARRAAEEEAELPASEEQYKEFAELIGTA